MPAFIKIFLAYAIVIVLHVSTMAIGARLFNIPVREVSYGMGRQLFKRGIFTIRLLPTGGYVKLKDSREEELSQEECHDAFDHQPLLVQAGIHLFGCLNLILLAIVLLGETGWTAFTSAFGQIFWGAAEPLTTAQSLLVNFTDYVNSHHLMEVAALIAAKLAAFNLLPIPPLNGGQILTILTGLERHAVRTVERLKIIGVIVLCLASVCWLFAAGVYIWRLVA